MRGARRERGKLDCKLRRVKDTLRMMATKKAKNTGDPTLAALAEIRSAITLLSERIEDLAERSDRVESKLGRVELLATEIARRLLSDVECRALSIPPKAPAGGGSRGSGVALVAKPRD